MPLTTHFLARKKHLVMLELERGAGPNHFNHGFFALVVQLVDLSSGR